MFSHYVNNLTHVSIFFSPLHKSKTKQNDRFINKPGWKLIGHTLIVIPGNHPSIEVKPKSLPDLRKT